MTKLVPKMKFKEEINKTNNFSRLNLINNKLKIKRDLIEESSSELNHSWDFTPFPNLFFPSQKTYAIREINGLNFRNTLNTNNTNLSNYQARSPQLFKSNSVTSIYKENKGDITKYRPPAFFFGTSREECKIPFQDFKEKISPSPGSYNLRPLLGLGGPSLKYSINKSTFLKNIHLHRDPGPGHYNIDKCDSKNNGSIILSNFPNSPICNFGKYKEKRDNNFWAHSEWNIKPDPARYNINSSVSMFNGTGKFPISTFKSNIRKSINRSNSLSKIGIKFIYPGPGHYNHHSIFMGHKY